MPFSVSASWFGMLRRDRTRGKLDPSEPRPGPNGTALVRWGPAQTWWGVHQRAYGCRHGCPPWCGHGTLEAG